MQIFAINFSIETFPFHQVFLINWGVPQNILTRQVLRADTGRFIYKKRRKTTVSTTKKKTVSLLNVTSFSDLTKRKTSPRTSGKYHGTRPSTRDPPLLNIASLDYTNLPTIQICLEYIFSPEWSGDT